LESFYFLLNPVGHFDAAPETLRTNFPLVQVILICLVGVLVALTALLGTAGVALAFDAGCVSSVGVF
jgi:hypothetical protein